MVWQHPNQVWSADFIREALAIAIDTSLQAERLSRVFERLQDARGLADRLRVDNGPGRLGQAFVDWLRNHGVLIQIIQPGKPNQNAYIERFNRTYREEVLDMYLFRDLDEVRDVTRRWLAQDNEVRPHHALGGVAPASYKPTPAKTSTSELSAWRGSLRRNERRAK